MKHNLTELVFILDRSGSMHGLEADTIGGFNSLIEKQQKEKGKAYVTTVLFSSSCEIVHDRVNVKKVKPMTQKEYCTGGCTALLDAIGSTVEHIGTVHKYARQKDIPAHTLFVITTDGMENASRQYTCEQIRRMIESRKEEYGWEFLFLGANIDAARTAADFGIDADHAADYHSDAQGTRLNYEVLSDTVSCMRANAAAPIGAEWKRAIDQDYQARDSADGTGSV